MDHIMNEYLRNVLNEHHILDMDQWKNNEDMIWADSKENVRYGTDLSTDIWQVCSDINITAQTALAVVQYKMRDQGHSSPYLYDAAALQEFQYGPGQENHYSKDAIYASIDTARRFLNDAEHYGISTERARQMLDLVQGVYEAGYPHALPNDLSLDECIQEGNKFRKTVLIDVPAHIQNRVPHYTREDAVNEKAAAFVEDLENAGVSPSPYRPHRSYAHCMMCNSDAFIGQIEMMTRNLQRQHDIPLKLDDIKRQADLMTNDLLTSRDPGTIDYTAPVPEPKHVPVDEPKMTHNVKRNRNSIER